MYVLKKQFLQSEIVQFRKLISPGTFQKLRSVVKVFDFVRRRSRDVFLNRSGTLRNGKV